MTKRKNTHDDTLCGKTTNETDPLSFLDYDSTTPDSYKKPIARDNFAKSVTPPTNDLSKLLSWENLIKGQSTSALPAKISSIPNKRGPLKAPLPIRYIKTPKTQKDNKTTDIPQRLK